MRFQVTKGQITVNARQKSCDSEMVNTVSVFYVDVFRVFFFLFLMLVYVLQVYYYM